MPIVVPIGSFFDESDMSDMRKSRPPLPSDRLCALFVRKKFIEKEVYSTDIQSVLPSTPPI